MKLEKQELEEYLLETELMDYSHFLIAEILNDKFQNFTDKIELVQGIYEFVRDEIKHSWDIQSRRITIKASDVLLYREGICYAKSILLVALLRSKGIPAGFCYQKLTLLDTPESGYAIHALNAVYFASVNRWVRLDARGNKIGIKAEFALDEEKLAFPVRFEMGEIDYPIIYSNPHIKTISVLQDNTDCLEMYMKNLPSEL
jgi:transglutaminase-like putative cysteine protease